MCGVVGYAGHGEARVHLLVGLARLEHRGYDSAGLCTVGADGLSLVRAVGRVETLRRRVNGHGAGATTGIAHARWATHGTVCERNAHPLVAGDVAIALNGIIENHRELRRELGGPFSSETDAEVVAHLIARAYAGDLAAAVRTAYTQLDGHFAFVAVHRDQPGTVAGVRRECPLLAGLGDGETYLASSQTALRTRRVTPLEDGEVALATAAGLALYGRDGRRRSRAPIEVVDNGGDVSRDGHESFMLKEIHEQPAAVRATLAAHRGRGARTLAITNSPGSQITREVDAVLHTRAGVEVGVAATKTFTTQVALLYRLALHLAGADPSPLDALPGLLAATLLTSMRPVDALVERHFASPYFVFLGRHAGVPVSLEGALKLKEIAYVPAEAHPAGEMKHGPIALLTTGTPVICVATRSYVHRKLLSNLEEARARGAQLYAIADAADGAVRETGATVLPIPGAPPLLAELAAAVPLQLLAHGVARRRGLDVDRPRNLAKTVTVE